MLSPEQLKVAVGAVADQLKATCREHEECCHDGEICLMSRAALAAMVAKELLGSMVQVEAAAMGQDQEQGQVALITGYQAGHAEVADGQKLVIFKFRFANGFESPMFGLNPKKAGEFRKALKDCAKHCKS